MNIQKSQLAIEWNVVSWDDEMDIGERVQEIRDSQRYYENDVVEIQQIVDFGRVTERSHRILILMNLIRDLDNPGEKIIR